MIEDNFDEFVRSLAKLDLIGYGPAETFRRDLPSVVAVLDAFSADCFKPEFQMVPVSPADYRQAFDYYSPKLLLIESAWQGNAGSWTHQLVGSNGPRPQFLEFLATARSYGIPIVFWNKEDPPHYEDFLPVAKRADLVLTTAGELVDSYVSAVGHTNVATLPFAAQPEIHHPFGTQNRSREICFAGQYFAHKYPERREQMEYLFPPASRYDFSIFSRELGNDPNYAFPPPYDLHVRGSVPYTEMVEVYRQYKMFLNVNSVTSSSTMCARRIFEITASGGVVVSAPSAAISNFYADDEVFTPADSHQADAVFANILNDDEQRAAAAHLSWRRTLSENTYRHRVDTIFRLLGDPRQPQVPTTTVLVDPRCADHNRVQETVSQVQSIVGCNGEVRILDFGDWSDRLESQYDHVRFTLSDLAHLETDRLIVASARFLFANHAFDDLILALDSYPDRKTIAKTAYDDEQRLMHREGVELTNPPLWGANRRDGEQDDLVKLVQSRVGVYDVLDYFNVLEHPENFIPSTDRWMK